MSSRPPTDPWDEHVRATARQFRYPATPPIAGRTRAEIVPRPVRRGVWVLAAVVLIASSLLAVPPVRAALHAWLRIGAIEFVSPSPTANTPAPPSTPGTPVAPSALLDLAGETTLDAARAQVPFPILLPAFPNDLDTPDRVYVQDLNGPAVILVWLDPHDRSRVRLSLQALSSDAFAQKIVGEQLVDEVTVNGENAAWVRGDHLLQLRDTNGDSRYDTRHLVSGNVLIWETNEVTYRLETDQPLREAVRIAESLR
jgi:hypothetical protein